MSIYDLINKRKDVLVYGTSDIVNEGVENCNIDNPDEYIEDAMQEFIEEGYGIIGELYANQLIVEEAAEYCDDNEYLESIEEAFKEEVNKKAKKY